MHLKTMKNIQQIQKEARSESMNKWIGRLEHETEFDAEGSSPTERMEDIIAQIKAAVRQSDVEAPINELIAKAFEKGVQAGFARALTKFCKGAITSRKVPNENEWILTTLSTQYQITAKLPTASNEDHRATVKIKLADHGFE